MNVLINQLVHSLLQKATLEECSIIELQQLTGEYPYFSTAQVLLTKKLQSENSWYWMIRLLMYCTWPK